MKLVSYFFLMTLLLSPLSKAETISGNWSVAAGTGAYMGENYIGAAYGSENKKHITEFSYGLTEGDFGSDVEQFNLQYSFSPFEMNLGKFRSNILGIGTILSRWNSSAGFVTSPSQYPEQGYYPMTRYRLSLLLSHMWDFKNFSVFVNWALLDQTAIALYNNPEYVDRQEIWSLGFGLRWAW